MFEEDHLGIIICSHVFQNTRPILLVAHHEDGFQMLCGDVHEGGANDRPHMVGLGHLLARDPSLRELDDLDVEWQAERESPGMPWVRSPAER